MIAVIGGGPAGCYTATLLAKKGEQVTIYEKKKQIGVPVQCTGIVTSAIDDIVKMNKKFIVNKINKFKFYSPNGKSFSLKLKSPDYVISRSKFDQHLAEKALDAGVEIKFKQKFMGVKKDKVKINSKEEKSNYLIGADGPNSAVAKFSGLNSKRKNVIGAQARIKTSCEPDTVEIWLGYGHFAWNVPEDENHSRIGCISNKNAQEILQKLIDIRAPDRKIIEYQGGLIPSWQPRQKIQNENIMLIGDAASQVKATTYGGLFYGLSAAKELAKNIDRYEENCKKKFGRDLLSSYLIRKVLNRFNQKDFDKLVKYVDAEKIKNILKKHDRDHATKILSKVLLVEPRLLKFSKKLVF